MISISRVEDKAFFNIFGNSEGDVAYTSKKNNIYSSVKQHSQHQKLYKTSLVPVNVKYTYDKNDKQIINVNKSWIPSKVESAKQDHLKTLSKRSQTDKL